MGRNHVDALSGGRALDSPSLAAGSRVLDSAAGWATARSAGGKRHSIWSSIWHHLAGDFSAGKHSASADRRSAWTRFAGLSRGWETRVGTVAVADPQFDFRDSSILLSAPGP